MSLVLVATGLAALAAPSVANAAASATDSTAPGAVTHVLAVVDSGSVHLLWDNPTAADFSGVMIRRAVGSTPPTLTTGTLVADTGKSDFRYSDSGLAPATRYSYALFAHDATPNYAAAAKKTETTTTAATCRTTAAKLGNNGQIAAQVVAFGSDGQPYPYAKTQGTQTLIENYDFEATLDVLVADSTGFATSPVYSISSDGFSNDVTAYTQGRRPGLTSTGFASVTLAAGVCDYAEVGVILQPAPGSVRSVLALVTPSAVRLTWTNPDTVLYSGAMIRRAAGATAPTLTTGTLVTDTAASATSFTDSHLGTATQYTYAIFAHNVANYYAPAAVKTIITTTPATCQTTPAALGTKAKIALQVIGFGPTGQPSSTVNRTGATAQLLNEPSDAPFANLIANSAGYAVSAPLAGNASYTLQGLGQEEPPGLFVSGTQNAAVVAGECVLAEIGATTIAAPGPVTDVVATETTSAVRLNWVNPGAPDFYGVMIRRAIGATPPTLTTGTLVTSTLAGTNTFTDAHLAAGTQYSYALFASNATPSFAAGVTKTVSTTTAATCKTTAAQLTTKGAIATRVIVFAANGQPSTTVSAAGFTVRVLAQPSGTVTSTLTTDSTGFAVTAPLAASTAGMQYSVVGQGKPPTLQVLAKPAVSLVPGECILTELAAIPVPDTTAPGRVTQTIAERDTTAISLAWVNPTAPDLQGVVIRRNVGNNVPTLTTGTLVANVGKTVTSVEDDNLATATTYTYALFAYDTTGNYAAPVIKTETTTSAATCGTTAAALGSDALIAFQGIGFGATGQPDPTISLSGYSFEILSEPNDIPEGDLPDTNAAGFSVTSPLYGVSYDAGYYVEGGIGGAVGLAPGESLLEEFPATAAGPSGH